MSSRLATVACSFVAASLVAAVPSIGSLAFADRAMEPAPAAGAPAMRRVAPTAPAEQVPPAPGTHFAQPPPGRVLPAHPGLRPDVPALDHDQLVIVLRAARAKNLAAFRAYEAAGVFPSNTYENGALNVWRDRDGHLCAAATIISKSGATELVGRVAEQNNFIKLADVQQGPIEDWILTSGLTQEELVAIQKPFNRVTRVPSPVIAPDLRTAETARLKAVYKQVEAQIVNNEAASLDLAAARLLKHPNLAWPLIGA